MKNWKRLIAALLALVLCIGQIPAVALPAHAADGGYSEGLSYALSEDGNSYIVTGIGSCTDTDLVIPDTYNGLPVTAIGENAFSGNKRITAVTLPGSVTTIAWGAFSGCRNLTSVNFAEGLVEIDWYAFSGCNALTSVSLPSTVTSIGAWAFKYCMGLIQFHIPANVHTFEHGVFYCCENLVEITVDEQNPNFSAANGVMYSKNGETLVCYPVGKTDTTFNVPTGVTTIGGNAFLGASRLHEIVLPESLQSVGNNAFEECQNLQTITIPTTVTSVGSAAFKNCTMLREILVAEGNEFFVSVDGVLYDKDMSLLVSYPAAKADLNYAIPYGVDEVLMYAFWGNQNLREISIPASMTMIHYGAFRGCNNLISAFIPNTVTFIEHQAFCECYNLSEIRFAGTEKQWNAIEKIDGWDNDAGEYVGGYTIVFDAGCSKEHIWTEATCTTPKICICCGLTDGEPLGHNYVNDICDRCGRPNYSEGLEYTLSKDGTYYIVTGIGTCTDTDLVIPATYNGLPVKEIGNYAFSWIKHTITSVCLPDTITRIGMEAFQGCQFMTSINIPEGVQTIDYGAFWSCESLTSLHIPASVTYIGPAVVAYCWNLLDLTVDENNPAYCVDHGVFYNKNKTELIAYLPTNTATYFVVPDGVTIIRQNAFEYCRSLTEIILPETLTTIESGGFHNCNSLRNITIPAGVTYIGGGTFENNDCLAEIIIQEGNRHYCAVDGVLYNKEMTQLLCYPAGKQDASFEVPDSVTSIDGRLGGNSFRGADALVSIKLPQGVTSIPGYAFIFCANLEQVYLPAGITYIGSGAFNGCQKLTDIFFAGSEIQWNNIEKQEQWNCIDWNGTVGNFTIHYGVDCEVNGHNWADATCTAPKTCIYCGTTEGTALGHNYVNDTCDRCGRVNYDGKIVKIYFPWNNFYMTTEPNGNGLYYGDRSAAAAWAMEMDANGYYTFCVDGLYLTSGDTGNYLFLSSDLTDCARWEWMDAGNGNCYLRNVGAVYKGNHNQYLEFYRNWFTTYGFNANNDYLYTFRLDVVTPCEAYGHSWTDANCQQERVCTVCGISGGMGLHQYNTKGFCDLCGTRCSLGLDYMLEGNYYVVTGMGSCTDAELIIPNNYNGLPVAKIAAEAFWNRNELISVTVPGTVTVIEQGALGACYELQNVYLSEGVETIGRYAFQDCTCLTSIHIPSTVTGIKDQAFSWCSGLRSIHLPAGLTTLGNNAFYYCWNLQQITVDADNANFCAVDDVLYTKDMTTLLLYPAAKEGASFAVPSTVTTIGNAAFARNRNLTEVILPEGLLSIGGQAFQDCSNLRNVALPSTLTAISYNAFRSCAISTITIPARVSEISNGIFAGCENLTEILVEQGSASYCSVDGVWYTADMTTLLTYPAGKPATSFAIPEGVNSLYVESFNGCQYLQEVIFPASLTSISNSAFQSCNSLTTVVLPEGVTRIENYTFNDCYNLQSITIPVSVTYLGNWMLGYCNHLTNVYYMGTVTQWEAIEKANQWNMIDWNGKTWDSLVRFCGECNLNGHNWQAATCTKPVTCSNCGLTEGKALGHNYVDDVCTRCGMMNYDGKVVKIYSPYGQRYLGTESHKDGMILSTYESEAAMWTMIQDENGYYYFVFDGIYLGVGGGNYSLYRWSDRCDYTQWELISVDGGFYLRNVYAYQNGWGGEYLYFYSSVFTSLSFDEKRLEQFTFQLLPVTGCDAYGHTWSDANCQQEKICTVCGISGGLGDHQYVGTVCVVCGKEHVSEGLEYRLSDDRRSYIVVGIGSCMDSELIIPATYNGLPVTRIEDYAFEQCRQLVTVIMPEGMQSIGWGAFENCDNLKQVQLPQSLIEIEGWAFAYCGQLEDICIPAGVTDYRAYTFIGCYSLEQIAVAAENPALTAQDGVLYSKDMQTLLCYPAGKTGSFAVPASVRTIANSAFEQCGNLTAIELPEGLREIGYGAFSGCHGLQQLQIPATVVYIESYAFENCHGLTSVTIPAGLVTLGSGVFMRCDNLTEILVEEGNHAFRSVDGVLYTYNGQILCAYPAGKAGTSFAVPASVEIIRSHAFQGCHLTEVVLPHGLTVIENLAFQGCNDLRTITIPVTVNQIGWSAFNHDYNLRTILYAGSEEAWNAIDKQEGWNDNMGEYEIIVYAFCREGHTIVEATCVAPRHCVYCDYTEGDVLPHVYENGSCIYCGEVDHGTVIAEGICGDNITWALYEDGLLNLMGQGEMYNYVPGEDDAPWLVYADRIKSLKIGDNITWIGNYAFVGLTGLTELTIPADVEYVGSGAFAGCTGLEKLYLFGMMSCGFDLFEGCTNLKEVFLFHIDFYYNLMYLLQRMALEDQMERLYILSNLIDISNGEFCTFTCTNAPEYVFVGEYAFVMFTKGNHRRQEMIAQEASCYEWGSAYDYCDLCGAEYNWRELPPMHSYDEKYTCMVCGNNPEYVLNCGLRKQDLIKGEDGVYYTHKGQPVLIAVAAPIELLDGQSLADFVNAYSDELDMETWAKLLAVTDEEGYAPLTDETYEWFLAVTWEYLLGEQEILIGIFLGFHVEWNHKHKYSSPEVIAPTCTEPGYTLYICKCGASCVGDMVPALGHQDRDKDGFCDYGCGTEVIPNGDALVITAEDVRVLTGKWATVTLWVERNPGFQGMSLYPVITDTNGNQVFWPWEVDNTNSAFNFDVNVGTMIVLTADEDCTGTGVLLEVRFFVGEEVEVGEYTISFRLYQDECFNEANEIVAVELPTITVNALNAVYGDANGDGTVSLKDALLLRQYLANRDPDTGESSLVVEAGADANGDGTVSLKDALLLRQYLANRDPDTGESTVVLGPK